MTERRRPLVFGGVIVLLVISVAVIRSRTSSPRSARLPTLDLPGIVPTLDPDVALEYLNDSFDRAHGRPSPPSARVGDCRLSYDALPRCATPVREPVCAVTAASIDVETVRAWQAAGGDWTPEWALALNIEFDDSRMIAGYAVETFVVGQWFVTVNPVDREASIEAIDGEVAAIMPLSPAKLSTVIGTREGARYPIVIASCLWPDE